MTQQPSAPLVSIVIPTYNMGRLVGRTIDSYLSQTERDLEIVISDNASTDDTAEVVARYRDPRVRYVRNASNIGMINNFNAGLRLARGQFVGLVAADEFALGTRSLERRLELVRRDPEVDFVWCGYDFEKESEGGRIYSYDLTWPRGPILTPRDALTFVLTRMASINPRITTVLFRREILAALDYRIPLVHGGDQIVAATWLLHSRKAAYVPETLCRSYTYDENRRHQFYGRELPFIGEGPWLMLRFIDEWRPRLIAMRVPIVRVEAVQLARLAKLIVWMPDFEFDNFWYYTSLFMRRATRLLAFCAWGALMWAPYLVLRILRKPYWALRRRLARLEWARAIYATLRRRKLASGATKIIPR
jgi:glycosyltransferase involved in cell wall biosynthesis